MIFILSVMIVFGVLFIGSMIVNAIKNANNVINGAKYVEGGALYEENHEPIRYRSQS
jgi:hypothetical protein